MRQLLTLLLLATAIIGNSQNHVKNPSFENSSNCPGDEYGLNDCPGWEQSLNSPMIGFFPAVSPLLHTCATDTNYWIPINRWGTNTPECHPSGCDAYGMITTMSTFVPNTRNFLVGTLNAVLIPGITYYVRFSLNVGESSRILTNNIGMKFYSGPPIAITPLDDPEINYTGIVEANVAHKWIIIRGKFIPDGVIRSFAIGNFHTDSLTASEPVGSGTGNCYYFIDNVCISPDSNSCFIAAGIKERIEPLTVSQINGHLIRISKKVNELVRVFNVSGKFVKQSTEEIIDLSEHSNGMYILEVNGRRGKVIRY